jgi:histidine triad (HIT) family protein
VPVNDLSDKRNGRAAPVADSMSFNEICVQRLARAQRPAERARPSPRARRPAPSARVRRRQADAGAGGTSGTVRYHRATMIVDVPDCLFCGIAAGQIPATIVLDGKRTLAFRDINPQAPTHVLVIPRDHYNDVAALAEACDGLLAELVSSARAVAAAEGVEDSGYRVVFNTGADGGQTVGHVHAHVLGGRPMTWPPG